MLRRSFIGSVVLLRCEVATCVRCTPGLASQKCPQIHKCTCSLRKIKPQIPSNPVVRLLTMKWVPKCRSPAVERGKGF